MTLDQIKAAVDAGKTVHWANTGYQLIKDSVGQWLIHCTFNDCYWGLTHRDGKTMNGREDQFFIAPKKRALSTREMLRRRYD